MVGKCTEGQYKGELCLKPPTSYPVTENGKLSPGRVRNAAARGSQQGVLATLKANGLCTYMRKIGAESDVCKTAAASASKYGIKL